MTAWNWGQRYIDDFPPSVSPFKMVEPFPAEIEVRTGPPNEDFLKVMQLVDGQDMVMLIVFYYTAARAGEVFRLTWKDINFEEKKIKLQDRKTKGGKVRDRWLNMDNELANALAWWRDNRQCKVDNVFFRNKMTRTWVNLLPIGVIFYRLCANGLA